MARLALSIGLGIVGGLLTLGAGGFAIGFAVGSVVGGIAGSLLFPPSAPLGPRLNDLQVASSAPGNPIPFGYGAYMYGGQIIWAQEIQEHKKNQSAKGGPSVTTYDYTCTFAVSFGFGPGSIAQLWGDSQVLYDTTGTQQIGTLQDSNGNTVQLNVTLYGGDEFQMPDPIITSIQGANTTPAFRGQIYAVFDNLDLTNFGNRIPNMRSLVYFGEGAPAFPNQIINAGPPIPQWFIIDDINRVYYGFTVDRAHVYKYSLVDNSVFYEDMAITFPSGPSYLLRLQPGVSQSIAADCDPQGFVWALVTNNSTVNVLIQYDPNTWEIVQTIDAFDSGGVLSNFVSMNMFSPGDGNTYIAAHATNSNEDTFILVNCSNATQTNYRIELEYPENISFASLAQLYISSDGLGNAYITSYSNTYGKWYIWNIATTTGPTVQPVFTYPGNFSSGTGMSLALLANPQNNTVFAFTSTGILFVIDAVGWTVLAIYGNNPTTNSWPGANDAVALDYLILDPNNNVQECTTAGSTGQYEPGDFPVGTAGQDWNPDIGGITQDGQVRWTNLGPSPFFQSTTAFGPVPCAAGFHGRVQNGIFLLSQTTAPYQVSVIRAADLTTIQSFDLYADFYGITPEAIDDWQYDSVYGSIIVGSSNYSNLFIRSYIVRGGSSGETLDVIITDLAGRAGIPATSLALTEVSDITCLGYLVSSAQGATQIIAPLCQAYLFDLVESDFQLVAVPRGQSSTWTIPETDLGLEQDKRKLTETLSAYTDVPVDVTVTYVDPALDYQQGSQLRKRHSGTTKSLNQTIINLPFVMGVDDAIQLADKLTWLAELERQTFDFNTWKAIYILMDPTDVITFTYEGLTFIARNTKNSIGQNYAVEISGVNQDANAYLSSLSGANQSGFVHGGVAAYGPTILYLLDTTLMQDKDAAPTGQTGTYFAFASPVVDNPGATLFQSPDQQNWTGVAQENDHIAYGFSSAALPAPSTPWTWDMVNTVTLFFATTGVTLSSTTMINVLNGANGVLIGKELVQYLNAVQNANGSWTISGLLRGRRGTEWACGSHVIGEACFFPQVQGGLHRLVMNTADLGILTYFKAITIGGDLNSGPSQPFTLQGNDVRPYAPCQVYGTRDGSGNLTIVWQRRTRVSAIQSIAAGVQPLSEASEQYDVVITDGLGNVVRTFSDVTPPGGGWSAPAFPNVVYTDAEQISDFGIMQTTVHVQIYQKSALVGRGFACDADITVPLSGTEDSHDTTSGPAPTLSGSGILINGT